MTLALQSARKARGAFFTPTQIADFLSEWAIRAPDDRILEPSCGEAALLLSAGARLQQLGVSSDRLGAQLEGHDVHSESILNASRVLANAGMSAKLSVGDFFERRPEALFDVVIGNPPYVRYQNFSGELRARSLEAALRQGVRLNQLASSWAAFTVHASAFLRPAGRLALVLPAELLTVKYAAQIRRFLLNRFASVRLVLFEELVFPGVLEEVVLLLAEGQGSAESFEVFQAKDVHDLQKMAPSRWTGFKPGENDKWTGALVSARAFDIYEGTIEKAGFDKMLDWGETYLGAVTGNNGYFTLSRSEAKSHGLSQRELIRISPPGAKHLRGLNFSEAGWESLASANGRCYLFWPGDEPSRAARKYIAKGEASEFDETYKCSMRDPWWRVPLVAKPDFLFTYMNHDRIRLIRNGAGVQFLNSLYGVLLTKSRKKIGKELFALTALNSVTLLGGEMVGRSYGGGLLKHEPKEVDLLPVPSFDAVVEMSSRLRAVCPQIGALLRRTDITPALEAVDRIILQDYLGMSVTDVQALRQAREMLFQRRCARARSSNGTHR